MIQVSSFPKHRTTQSCIHGWNSSDNNPIHTIYSKSVNTYMVSKPLIILQNVRQLPDVLKSPGGRGGGGARLLTLNVEVIGMLVGNFFWKTLKNTQILILNPKKIPKLLAQ